LNVTALQRLLDIMQRLRDPDEGCPWDLEQDFESIAPYTIEEAYEVDDAIRRGDMEDLRGELGDLLLQVVYHAQMASEADLFDFEAVAQAIGDKLIRRHPHVFAQPDGRVVSAVRGAWEDEKARERDSRARARSGEEPAGNTPDTLFDGIPAALPALMRAAKLQSRADRAARAPDLEGSEPDLLSRVSRLADRVGSDQSGVEPTGADREDVGRLLFEVVAVARRLGVDPEAALRDRCALFERAVQPQRKSQIRD